MKPVIVRSVTIGEGIPKVCVPIVGRTRKEIVTAGREMCDVGADVVEWRADWYEDVFHFEEVEKTVVDLREALGEIPLLFTFRTAKEGGEKVIQKDRYIELNQKVSATGMVDLIDVEVFTGDAAVCAIVETAHKNGVKVVGSNHDFYSTPAQEEIVARLCRMQEMDIDLPKIAVMPTSKKDVLTLLSATEEMYTKYADRPIITMAMARAGVISRLCGEVFGSALTFGAAQKSSAPGQMDVRDLKIILDLLHKSL